MQKAPMPSADVSICFCFAVAAGGLWVIHFGFETSDQKSLSLYKQGSFLVLTPRFSALRGKTTGRKH